MIVLGVLTRRRRSLPKASVVIFASTAAVLVAYGLLVAFLLRPPLLG